MVAGGSPTTRRDLIPGPGYWESEAAWRGTSSSLVGSTPGARGLRGGAFTPCWLVALQGMAVWLVGPCVVAASAPAHCELQGELLSAQGLEALALLVLLSR